jgi:SAM-dependent methyltransferase
MSLAHESFVASRFDALQPRFRPSLGDSDYRLLAVRQVFRPLVGLRLLDLGCGKGRFAARLRDEGADVVGLDVARAMLAEAAGLPRVLGSARRLPFGDSCFDGVLAIEVFQHVPPRGLVPALAEIRRVLRPGGRLAILDRNAVALDGRRPWLPRSLVKRIDESRGLWMYRPDDPIRERWFRPGWMVRRLARHFDAVDRTFLLAPDEARHLAFRRIPTLRSMVLWTATRPGGDLA